MTYIIRNTIVLGIVLFILLGVGVYVTFVSQPKKLDTINAEIKKLEIQLQNTPDLNNQFNILTAELASMKERWETRSKDIPPSDITGETYGYLNRIIDLSGDVKMHMRYNGPRDFPKYGYNIYTINGEASFYSFYKFLWYIENGRRLMKLPTIKVTSYETKDPETEETKVLVLFEGELWAYYSPVPELNNAPARASLRPAVAASSPFYPLILREIPPPQTDEIEIQRSELKAVIPGKAFVVDQASQTRVLEEGDPVYLGYVTRILPELGKIECLLNKGGISERFELHIRVGEPVK